MNREAEPTAVKPTVFAWGIAAAFALSYIRGRWPDIGDAIVLAARAASEPQPSEPLHVGGDAPPRPTVVAVDASSVASGGATTAPRCYITREGVLGVPENIREALGLPNGGGVMMFPVADGRVTLMSDERFLRDLPDDDGREPL